MSEPFRQGEKGRLGSLWHASERVDLIWLTGPDHGITGAFDTIPRDQEGPISGRDAMKPPRIPIYVLLIFVAVVALNLAVLPAFSGYPRLGAAVIGIALQVACLLLVCGRGRSFWIGFLATGSLSMASCFLALPPGTGGSSPPRHHRRDNHSWRPCVPRLDDVAGVGELRSALGTTQSLFRTLHPKCGSVPGDLFRPRGDGCLDRVSTALVDRFGRWSGFARCNP